MNDQQLISSIQYLKTNLSRLAGLFINRNISIIDEIELVTKRCVSLLEDEYDERTLVCVLLKNEPVLLIMCKADSLSVCSFSEQCTMPLNTVDDFQRLRWNIKEILVEIFAKI